MPRDGRNTRQRILDIAHRQTLRQGFTATSIEGILAEAGITKGAFFHHFKSKNALARALVERYAEGELQMLSELVGRAEKLSRDPLQQLLLVIGLFQEWMEGQADPPEGCLFASFCYQSELFPEEMKGIAAETMVAWRQALATKIRAAAEQHPPSVAVDAEAVADMFTTLIEGAFVVARTLDAPGILTEQLGQYRNYLELLFAPRR